jgi:cytochrome c-type biogenesis protein
MSPAIYDMLLAFAAGLLSVLSPACRSCRPLSLISGISVEEMQGGATEAVVRARVMRACLGFVSGFSAVFVLMGVGAVSAGHLVRTWLASLFGLEFGVSQIAGLVVVVLGAHDGDQPDPRVVPIRAQLRMGRQGFASSL